MDSNQAEDLNKRRFSARMGSIMVDDIIPYRLRSEENGMQSNTLLRVLVVMYRIFVVMVDLGYFLTR